MTKVWIVEQGEYSGSYVSGVYSTEENARVAAGKDGDVNEFDLDLGIDQYRSGLRAFHVEMSKNGDTIKAEKCDFLSFKAPSFDLMLRNLDLPRVYDVLSAFVWAKDEQHAVKITNEQREQIIASGAWDEYARQISTTHTVDDRVKRMIDNPNQ